MKSKQNKHKKYSTVGIISIFTTFNNTIITITTPEGGSMFWTSCGSKGFKGSKKSTPFAAQITAEDICQKALEHGLKSVEVKIKGPGSGRESALRAIINSGIKLTSIKDTTGTPHNGCRPPKRRRI